MDALGLETQEPIIVPANRTFGVYVLGFDNDSINFGANGLLISDEDVNCAPGLLMVTDGEKSGYYGFSSPICVYIGFTGIFDDIDVLDNRSFNNVPEGTALNGLRLSDDGKTCLSEGQTADGDYNLGGVGVGTAMSWFDGEGNENYYLESDDDISWITWSVDVSQYSTQNWWGYNFISCEGEALPAGVTGRSAIVRVVGHGVVSDPFVVLQGDAQMPSAIESVKKSQSASNRVYNIAGQQLPASAKGLLIKGGKKMIVK